MLHLSPPSADTATAMAGDEYRRPAADTRVRDESLESINLLDGGKEAYPRMLHSIEQAKNSVYLEVYAFAARGIGERFIEALGQAAQRGVAVQISIDGWGSARSGVTVADSLRRAGCTVRIYSRLMALWIGHYRRNHRKVLVVDDQIAFVGGINIGDENLSAGNVASWADLALEIRGSNSARLGEMIRGEPRHSRSGSLQIYLSGLGGGWRLRRRYLKSFAMAKERIDLAHGYFLPDPGVVRAITSAARRGVQVRLLLAGHSDVPFACAATRSLYRRLLGAGVEIHEWDESVLHAKVATVDARRLLVGSFNLDPFSLTNREVLLEISDIRVVGQAEAWIEDHFARSRAVTPAHDTFRWQWWLLDPIGRVLAHLADRASRIMIARHRRRIKSRQCSLRGTES